MMRWNPFLLFLLFMSACAEPDSTPESNQLPAIESSHASVAGEKAIRKAPPALTESNFDKWQQLDDPSSDGWESEVFSNEAYDVLKDLGKAILSEKNQTPEQLFADEATYHFTSEKTAPSLAVTPVAGEFTVRRWTFSPESKKTIKGAAPVLSTLRETFHAEDTESARIKFKIISVEDLKPETKVLTRTLVESFAIQDAKAVERHAIWEIIWEKNEKRLKPLISEIQFLEMELTTRPHAGKLFFTDCTRSALEHDPSYQSQILRGLPYWLERQNRRRATDVYGFPGIAVGDVNDDGLEDVFLCESQGVPHCLFLQNPDGTLSNKAADWKCDWIEDARSALLVDLDNDGDEDLVVAAIGFLIIASNEGNSFELKATLPCSEDVTHLSAADYDLDGRLDLYVSAYLKSEIARPTQRHNPGYYIDANGGAPNYLFQNKVKAGVDWTFRNVTEETGLDSENFGQTLSTAWEDFDSDGDPDLYVANDFGSNPLYRNDLQEDGTYVFTNISDDAGTKDTAFGMSASWGDYNRDGQSDLYVANMWSSAGKRITTKEGFKPGIDQDRRDFFQHFARGNTLLRGDGEGGFDDISEDVGVVMGRWGWSSPFVDLNNDGWEDFVIANGFITGTGPGDL